MSKALRILLLAAVASASSALAAPVLTLNPPGGAVFGGAGATVGWGYTLTNPTNFLVVTGTSFLPVPLSSVGTYQDYLGTRADLVVVGPAPESPTISEAFNPATQRGIGAFHIAPTATLGTVTGNIVLNYELFSRSPNDPNFNPDTDLLVADATVSAAASVTVAPEPASLVLLASALPVGFLLRRRKR